MPKKNNNHKQDIQIASVQAKVDFTCERVSDLNGKVSSIEEKVDRIITNHLPHVEVSIARLDANQKILLFFMMAIVGALIGLYFN